ncbi:MAG: TM2 domain-containing protein [Succinivibrio sp.]
MASGKIIQVTPLTVLIGLDDGGLVEIPPSACSNFAPSVGHEVEVYSSRTDDRRIVFLKAAGSRPQQTASNPGEVQKCVYIGIAFFLGMFGIHKFYEGKIIQGLVYLLTNVICYLAFLICFLFWFGMASEFYTDTPLLYLPLYPVIPSVIIFILVIKDILVAALRPADRDGKICLK